MATLTPARITTSVGGILQDIRFHSVISEAHQATSEITKYPVQSGFQISTHAIRHNRKITIEAMISNNLIKGGKTSYQYSLSDNSKTIFNVLRDLVNFKARCTVLTNLGDYKDVVFTSFKTKQMAGMVDSMKLMLIGEELQISEAINGASPSTAIFSELSIEDNKARVDALTASGVVLSDNPKLETSTVDLGDDFSLDSLTVTGQAVTTTYVCSAQDNTTGAYTYEVHTTDTAVFLDASLLGEVVTALAPVGLPDLSSGSSTISDCLVDGLLVNGPGNSREFINTPMGLRPTTAFGVLIDTVTMSTNDVGQELLGLSSGCVIRGVTGSNDAFDFTYGISLPDVNSVIAGAVVAGNNSGKLNSKGFTLTPTILTLVG